jgi:peroxiredoxin
VAAYVAVDGRALSGFAALALASAGLWLWLGPLQPRRRRGEPAPRFSLVDEEGETLTLDSLLALRAPVLLVFSHPGCAACQVLLPEVGRWQSHFGDRITIAIVTRGAPETYRPARDQSAYWGFATDPFLVDSTGVVARAYGITATPSAVLIDERGRIASATARGAGEIVDLVAGELEPANVILGGVDCLAA